MKEGWTTKLLADIAVVGAGNSAPQDKALFVGGKHPFFRTSDVGRVHVGTLTESEDRLNDKGISRLTLHPAGTILIPKSGASTFLDHRVIMGVDGYVSSHLATVRAKPEIIETKYLFYYLLTVEARSLGVDTAYPTLSLSQAKAISVPFPPLSEQQRIVAILDEAFEGLATATANAEKNLKNARELFDIQLSLTMAQTADQYGSRRLADVVTRLTNGYVGPTRNIYLSNGVPYLLARHVRDNCLEFDGKTFVSDAFNDKNKKSKLKAGDVLLVQSGHIGHSAVVGPEHEGHNCHAMIVITPISTELSGDFLSLYFGSVQMKSKFEEIRSGSTVPHLTCGLVRELMIPLPGIAEQRRLVSVLKNLESATYRLKSLATEKRRRIDQLKQSILRKAFSGELTSPPSQAIQEAAE